MASNASESGAVAGRRPVIGLTTYLEQTQCGVWDVPAAFLPKVYFEAVSRAGGIAVLVPPQPLDEAGADAVLDGLDGIILTGGKDVDSRRYGQDPHPTNDAPRLDRDAIEDVLLSRAIARDIPFLGICRGLQVLNTTLGGSLIQHLPDAIGSTRYNAGGGVFTANPAIIEPGTKTAALLGDRVTVQSYHHQAIDEVAPGLTVSARGDDGIIQAVDVDAMTFGVAVQWHPEESAAEDARLFAGLVEAAVQYRETRKAMA
ncbi:gamma-glutamyl-gamma-aminobutyrate hydrolase family protein [Microcella sp.]|uniref:gamma-glutamyl-gamma-aminobutyrate hydrolase family protein n=1 Tax=Microcella sp. TaxID=1913979 RepID=UPI00299F5A9D|nr:gamma-glutamyl-gamma-aminobutyrate hydrolase family protein [Microcella sp.]MDX2026518.1 gamma-glutamyl-gamma-aminobutyrate hydrolase family protein [Microcella sp.]